MGTLTGKTIFITGGSRGIGLEIARKAARDGANITIAAKTADPHPKLPGTIYTAAEEIEAAGGKALPILTDIRFEEQVANAINKTVETFGGLDILINNASAINLTSTEYTDMKRYDLMHNINTRGTFLSSKLCIPHLKKSANPHVLNLAPPLNLNPRWFAPHVAYTMSKYGMSMCVLGMAEEFKKDGIAFNALWPQTGIATAAIKNQMGGDSVIKYTRTAAIMADAAHVILSRKATECTGNFFIDEAVLREEGISDFKKYQSDADISPDQLMPDLFIG